MIDWEKRCIELAEIIDRHRKDRVHVDMLLGWKMAQKLIEVQKIMREKNAKFLEANRCTDRKKRDKIWNEYMNLLHEAETEVNK